MICRWLAAAPRVGHWTPRLARSDGISRQDRPRSGSPAQPWNCQAIVDLTAPNRRGLPRRVASRSTPPALGVSRNEVWVAVVAQKLPLHEESLARDRLQQSIGKAAVCPGACAAARRWTSCLEQAAGDRGESRREGQVSNHDPAALSPAGTTAGRSEIRQRSGGRSRSSAVLRLWRGHRFPMRERRYPVGVAPGSTTAAAWL